MQASGKQRFVRIDVPDTRDERLIQQKRLDVPFMALQSFEKFGKIYRKSVWPGTLESLRQFAHEFEPSELADVVIDQCSRVELENGARIFARLGVPQQLAGHPEVHIQHATIQVEVDLFAAAVNAENGRAGETLDRLAEVSPRDAARGHRSMTNGLAQHVGRDGTNDRFDFGQLGQVLYSHLSWRMYSESGMKIPLLLLLAWPLMAQETIPLPLDRPADPSAPPEKIEERGKGGVVDRAITNISQPAVTVYLPAKGKANGTGIVIAPGGGYQHLAIDKEGHDVARWLNTLGIGAIVLKYRLPGSMRGISQTDLYQVADKIHVALEDAEAAVRLTRKNAATWNLKPNAIGMMGFSAGGHLAAMMGMVAPADARPNFLVLGYPAIPKVLDVTAATPPTFLVAADDDPAVNPADNAGRFFAALRAANVPAELLIYSSGGHGFGIIKSGKTAAAWPSALVAWLKEAHLD